MNGTVMSIIALAITFALIVLLDVFGWRRYLKTTTIAGIAVALLLLVLGPAGGVHALIKVDAFTYFFGVLFLLISTLVVLASHESTAVYNGSIILSTIGMLLAAAANDLIMLYLAIELVTAPTYVLVAYHKTPKRLEAGVKYFVVGIVASAIMLLGLAILSSFGTTSLSLLQLHTEPLFLLGIIAFVAGLGFKLGAFPFNFWIPDVYTGAPSEIAGFLAGASKKAAYAALLRVAVVLAAFAHWQTLFLILAALTMTIPNLIALLQTNARRMLAYSIMSHAGFLLMGVAAASHLGFTATLFHAFTHAFMVLGAFLVLGVFLSHHLESIDQLKGLGWKNPLLGASLTIFLLSLAGIPLLSGFASKFYLFYAALDAGLLWLVALAVINSVISLYYYFRIIRALYAYPGGGSSFKLRRGTLVTLLVCLLFTILAGIAPQKFIALASAAIQALF
jgi:proton-translocating NADH-quinone oxidoreductase chain N